MSNQTSSNENLNVKHVATLFDEVQNRYMKKLISIDERNLTGDERHKVYCFILYLDRMRLM
jgi:hypothetical protein